MKNSRVHPSHWLISTQVMIAARDWSTPSRVRLGRGVAFHARNSAGTGVQNSIDRLDEARRRERDPSWPGEIDESGSLSCSPGRSPGGGARGFDQQGGRDGALAAVVPTKSLRPTSWRADNVRVGTMRDGRSLELAPRDGASCPAHACFVAECRRPRLRTKGELGQPVEGSRDMITRASGASSCGAGPTRPLKAQPPTDPPQPCRREPNEARPRKRGDERDSILAQICTCMARLEARGRR